MVRCGNDSPLHNQRGVSIHLYIDMYDKPVWHREAIRSKGPAGRGRGGVCPPSHCHNAVLCYCVCRLEKSTATWSNRKAPTDQSLLLLCDSATANKQGVASISETISESILVSDTAFLNQQEVQYDTYDTISVVGRTPVGRDRLTWNGLAWNEPGVYTSYPWSTRHTVERTGGLLQSGSQV